MLLLLLKQKSSAAEGENAGLWNDTGGPRWSVCDTTRNKRKHRKFTNFNYSLHEKTAEVVKEEEIKESAIFSTNISSYFCHQNVS